MATVMEADRIGRALMRISHEILERNRIVDELALVGVRTRGVPIAARIAAPKDNVITLEILVTESTADTKEVVAEVRRQVHRMFFLLKPVLSFYLGGTFQLLLRSILLFVQDLILLL